MSDNRETFEIFINHLSHQNWTELPAFLHSQLVYNDRSISLDGFIHLMQEEFSSLSESTITVETVLTNHDGVLGARLKMKVAVGKPYRGVEPIGRSIEYARHVICHFREEKIANIQDISDWEEFKEQKGSIETVPHLEVPLADRVLDLTGFYRSYIACINEQTMVDELDKFCNDHVVWNGRRMDLVEYRGLMEGAQRAIPGIKFDVPLVLVNEGKQQIMARIEFAGTPVGELAGIQPTEKSVEFAEHVVYFLRAGKIATVLSVVDLDKYRRQLSL